MRRKGEWEMKHESLKQELKRFEDMYGTAATSPLVVALKSARLAISDLEQEALEQKKHALDFEEMYKQEHREKNRLTRAIDRIGFYCAGSEHPEVSEFILRVKRGEEQFL